MELVSIIMPYYRKKKFFKQSLYSVLLQSYTNLEVIIIYDDYDLDELDYIKKLIKNKKNIKLLINKKNYGVSHSRNRGIAQAKGKYLAFLDCDDYWNKSKVLLQINFMKKNNCDFSYTSYYIVNEKNRITGKWKSKKEITYNDLKFTCDIGLSTVILKKNVLRKLKFPELKTKEDYALWLKLAKKNVKMFGINTYLTYWRDSLDSLSKSTIQKIGDAFRVYRYHDKRGVAYALISVLIMCFYFLKKTHYKKKI